MMEFFAAIKKREKGLYKTDMSDYQDTLLSEKVKINVHRVQLWCKKSKSKKKKKKHPQKKERRQEGRERKSIS